MKVYIDPLGIEPSISELVADFGLSRESLDCLEFCQRMSSECWTGYVDHKIICCWGLIPPSILSNQAYLWMHSTPAVREHKFLLVRHSQKIIQQALSRYERIVGHCLASAPDSIRWLRWLGADFAPPVDGYRAFIIRRK